MTVQNTKKASNLLWWEILLNTYAVISIFIFLMGPMSAFGGSGTTAMILMLNLYLSIALLIWVDGRSSMRDKKQSAMDFIRQNGDDYLYCYDCKLFYKPDESFCTKCGRKLEDLSFLKR